MDVTYKFNIMENKKRHSQGLVDMMNIGFDEIEKLKINVGSFEPIYDYDNEKMNISDNVDDNIIKTEYENLKQR